MRAVMIMLGLFMVSAAHSAEVAIDRILPPVGKLGPQWTSNRVVLLVDPLSSPSEVADSRDTAEPQAVLESLRDGMRKTHRDAQAFVRYYRGAHQYGVFISRFDTKSSAAANWEKFVEEEKAAAVSLASPIGERFRFSNRHDMHNDLTFLRGRYFITVECAIAHGWEAVAVLARVIDDRLRRSQAEDE